MYNEETESSKLAKFLMIYDYVFVDTCSLMEDSFPAFMDTLEGSHEYWKDGFEVIVLGECVEELEKHSKSKDNQEARIEAKRALKILRHDKFKWHNRILTITKSKSDDGFADHAIFTAVSDLRIQNKVLIITQDRTLATDLRKLNNLDSQRGRFLAVYRLVENGDLEENPGEDPNQSSSRNYVSLTKTQNQSRPSSRVSFFHKDRHPSEKQVTESLPFEDSDSPVIANDRKLCANLNNPNYPLDRKNVDIDAQLQILSAMSSEELSKLSLAYTKDQLIQEKAKLGQPVVPKTPHPGENERPLPPRQNPPSADMKPIVVLPKPKEETVKNEKTVPPLTKAKPIRRSWYEFGSSIQEALTKAGSHSGIIFRDASVPYFAPVHGPYDLTSKDLDEVAKKVGVLKTGEAKDVPLEAFVVHVEKTEKDWKASLEVPSKEETPAISKAPIVVTLPHAVAVPVSKPQPIAVARPLSEEKIARKVSTPEIKKPVVKTPSKAKGASKALSRARRQPKKAPTSAGAFGVTAQDDHTAVPKGVTLVVGVPTNEGTKGFIERRARREDTTQFDVAPDPNKTNGKKVVSSSRQKKAASRPIMKPASPARGVKAPSHGVKQAKAVNASSALLSGDIVKEDKNLNAKINNPTYPVKDKLADLEAQAARLKSVTPEQEKGLFFSKAKIAVKIDELKKTK